MNRTDRLVAMLLLLQSKRLIRAQDIADHFRISIRTVYRDMNALAEAGVPICAEAGEGYSIIEGYHLPPVMFTREEASALFMGGEFIERLTDASVVKNARGALLKIQSVLPADTQNYIESLQASTAMLARGTTRDGFQQGPLTTIQDAIVHRKVLALEYQSAQSDGPTKREIEPLGLVYYSDRWHLIAYCRLRQGSRDFRTDRIRQIRPLDEFFSPRPGISLAAYLDGFNKITDPAKVQVRLDKTVADFVREKHGFGLVEEEATADGIIMTFMIPNAPWSVDWLLSLGPRAEVLAPASFRSALAERAIKLAALYQT